jgi:hypothetical protein
VQALWLAIVAIPIVMASYLVWRRPIAALYAFLVGLAFHNAVMASLYGAGLRGAPLTLAQAWKEILLAVALARVGSDAVRARRLPFRWMLVDWLALAFAAFVVCYALIPQAALGGGADLHGIGLGVRHDLVPVAAYFLGRSLIVGAQAVRRLAWTLVGAAAAVATIGLADLAFVSIGWWRSSAVPGYFAHLGFDYHGTGVNSQGTGGLPENFIYATGSEQGFSRRLVSVFLSPLASAYMLALALLALAALGLLSRRRWLGSALAVVCAAGLLYTFTRSAMLALAGAFVVLALARRRPWLAAPAAAIVLVAIVWVPVFPHVSASGKWTQADLVYQRKNAKEHGVVDSSAFRDSSTESHWQSLRAGISTIADHPQGYGVGNAGQIASRTGVEIKAGESNYTELGAELGIAGGLAWIAWNAALLATLLMAARRSRAGSDRRLAAFAAAALTATLALALQTDVIGDPWMAYLVWGLTGAALAPLALRERAQAEEPAPAALPVVTE